MQHENAKYGKEGIDHYHAYTRDFEEKHGLHGIAGNWQMPRGYTEELLEEELTARMDLPFRLRKFLVDELTDEEYTAEEKRLYFLYCKAEGVFRHLNKPEDAIPLYTYIHQLAERLDQENAVFFRQIWHELQELNPGLQEISVNSSGAENIYHAVLGVTSQFNADDIAFFLQDSASYGIYQNKPEYIKTRKSIYTRLGEPHSLCWLPSPTTMARIVTQLDAKTISFGTPKEILREQKENTFPHYLENISAQHDKFAAAFAQFGNPHWKSNSTVEDVIRPSSTPAKPNPKLSGPEF